MRQTRRRSLAHRLCVSATATLWLFGCAARTASPPVEPLPAAALAPAAQVATPPTDLETRLAAIFDNPTFANAYWGVRVERLNGDILFDRNGEKGFVPASNMKLYATAPALDILGPDFRYETKLDAVGTIADGRLAGDLVMVGSGDPSFGSWHLADGSDSRAVLKQWAEKVKAAGITEVDGDIIGDGRYFTDEYYSPYWELGDLPYWYATGSSGLCIEENCFRFTTAPGAAVGEPAVITLLPNTPYVTVVNETKTTAAGTSTNADIVSRDPGSNIVRFAGTVALDKKPFEQRGSVWDGTLYAAVLFKEALESEGVHVKGLARNIRSLDHPGRIDGAAPEARKTLATYTSPPMSELIAIVNKPSHNFFADQIIRTLGKIRKGEGSFDAGTTVAQEWLGTIGAPAPDQLKMNDGSGMARRNVVQPRQTCALLRHMYSNERLRKPFYDSLPIAGVDGTIRSRMGAPPTKGNVHAKTGFITRARALSGYVTDADGEVFVFSMMANQFTVQVSEANRLQDAACAVLAGWSEKQPAAGSQ